MRNFSEKYAAYDGIAPSSFVRIEGISCYNSNYCIGLKRKGMATHDLLYAISDDDNITEYYHIHSTVATYIGYELTDEGVFHLANERFT